MRPTTRRTVPSVLAALMGATLAATAGAGAAHAVEDPKGSTKTVVYDRQFGVCEQLGNDIYLPFEVRRDDLVRVTATGDIWSGVLFQGRTGPEGRRENADTMRYPMPGVPKFALLVRMDGGYRYAGNSFTRTAGSVFSQQLAFRVNDDVAGNGNGCFRVDVRVYR